MNYEAKNYDRLLGTAGFSDILLTTHFGLYQGYVKNTNKLAETLAEMAKEGKFGPEYAELKRRMGWEYNGMRLHELYFGNMTKDKNEFEKSSDFGKKISAEFGSYGDWEKDFKATGTMRGIGWTILYQDPDTGKLFNAWVTEHDMGHLAGARPLLVLDVFEHAYVLDYKMKRADYIEAFMKAIDWKALGDRLK
jgi:Fe-Mn family superoxide dismutase